MMMNVFKGYAKTADEDFVRYIQNKRDDHEDGSHRLTLEALMALAINRFDLKVQNKTWSVADKKDTRIIALEAAMEASNATIAKMVEQSTNRPKSTNPLPHDDKRFAWKLIPPGTTDKHTKKV